jgi:hypothetical protein
LRPNSQQISREREIGICIFKYELTSSFKKVLFQIVLILKALHQTKNIVLKARNSQIYGRPNSFSVNAHSTF